MLLEALNYNTVGQNIRRPTYSMPNFRMCVAD